MTILDIQMFIVMMSHWWTATNWLFALTPGEYQKSTISQGGGGGSIIDKNIYFIFILKQKLCGRRSPAVACWASDQWVASSNPLRGKFRH